MWRYPRSGPEGPRSSWGFSSQLRASRSLARVADWRGDTLIIRRGQKNRRVGGCEGGTKKRKGTKLLPVPEDLRDWLEDQLSAERRIDGEAFLFQNPDAYNAAGQWSETAMRRTWYAACAAVGIKVSLYEGTKHSTATALKAAGVEDRVLAHAAGHSDVRSIQRYAKLETEVIRSAFARLASPTRDGNVMAMNRRTRKHLKFKGKNGGGGGNRTPSRIRLGG